jgi:hypothetical protein
MYRADSHVPVSGRCISSRNATSACATPRRWFDLDLREVGQDHREPQIPRRSANLATRSIRRHPALDVEERRTRLLKELLARSLPGLCGRRLGHWFRDPPCATAPRTAGPASRPEPPSDRSRPPFQFGFTTLGMTRQAGFDRLAVMPSRSRPRGKSG